MNRQPDYRQIILLVVLFSVISIGAVLIYKNKVPEGPALVINSKSISELEFNRLFEKKPARQNKDGFIDSLIVKELLVQEAIKAGIQNEEQFRQSVKDHYEQTLVKHIIDRKFTSLTPVIDERILDRYIDLSDKILDLSIITYRKLDDIAMAKPEKLEKIRLPFARLSIDVKYDLLTLHESESSQASCTDSGSDCSVFRVNHIINEVKESKKEQDREKIRQLLMNHKRELLFNEWIDEIRKHSIVKKGAQTTGKQ